MEISEPQAKNILGISSQNVHTGNYNSEEFLPELKGNKAIRKFREMRENDSTIGAVMYATEQVLRDVKIKVVPSIKDNDEAKKWAEFVEQVFDDMDHTLDDHISESLSCLTYGFSWFEVVYKRRKGIYQKDPKKKSKYEDGYLGIRKLAPRAPWTVSKFDVDEVSGGVKGIFQNTRNLHSQQNYIPLSKSVYYKTTTISGQPSGRSILRNAYTSYERLRSIQQYEVIGIERELAGIPVGKLPSEYLSADASDDQAALRKSFETTLRDLKFNDQGYIIIPSDTYPGKEGEPTNQPLVDIKLMSSEGSRNINIDPVVRRYQHDIARSLLTEFIMLGSNSTGSYALSKSKTDLFLRGLESYINMIVDVINRQVVLPLWKINGFDIEYMPKVVAGDVAPHDLSELGSYLRNLNGAGIPLKDQVDIVEELISIPELPPLDKDSYQESLDYTKEKERQALEKSEGDNSEDKDSSSTSKDQNKIKKSVAEK